MYGGWSNTCHLKVFNSACIRAAVWGRALLRMKKIFLGNRYNFINETRYRSAITVCPYSRNSNQYNTFSVPKHNAKNFAYWRFRFKFLCGALLFFSHVIDLLFPTYRSALNIHLRKHCYHILPQSDDEFAVGFSPLHTETLWY